MQTLVLFHKQISEKSFNHLACCHQYNNESTAPFLSLLHQRLFHSCSNSSRIIFYNSDKVSGDIKLLQNPFSSEFEGLSPNFQLEKINLSPHEKYRYLFMDGDIINCYKMMPQHNFQHLQNFTHGMFSVFGPITLAKKISKMKYVKSKYCTSLSHEHLKSVLITGTTKGEPNIEEISSDKKFQTSH
jgi:hypothetical protein